MQIESQPLVDRDRTPVTEESISDKLQPRADAAFVLPDLNIPFEDNPVPGVVCGVS